MDVAVTRNEAIAIEDLIVHLEVAAAVTDEGVEFFKGAFVEEEVDALAGGEFAVAALAFEAVWTATEFGIGAAAFEFGDRILVSHHEPV